MSKALCDLELGPRECATDALPCARHCGAVHDALPQNDVLKLARA